MHDWFRLDSFMLLTCFCLQPVTDWSMSPPSEPLLNGAAISSQLQEDAAKTLNDNREYLLQVQVHVHRCDACLEHECCWIPGILLNNILHQHLMETLLIKQRMSFSVVG